MLWLSVVGLCNMLKSASLANLAIVGAKGGSNIGESFWKAALDLGFNVSFFETQWAYSSRPWLNSLCWRFADRRPIHQSRFQENLLAKAVSQSFAVLISTGLNPLSLACLIRLREYGVHCLHFSTDDPWNSSQKSHWFLSSLSAYHRIFTPRHSNFCQFDALAPGRVSWLPFGFDHHAIRRSHDVSLGKVTQPTNLSSSLFFVGGADSQRSSFMGELQCHGVPLLLVGDYWDRFQGDKSICLGHKPPAVIAQWTKAAYVNLIIPRHANRDGHTMRSFEAAALGGCLLVEDTPDHRQIFGDDGDCVMYYADALECSQKFFYLRRNPIMRRRLALAVQQRVWNGSNSYADRLQTMLAAC
jgi:spore maturation protein CgeB